MSSKISESQRCYFEVKQSNSETATKRVEIHDNWNGVTHVHVLTRCQSEDMLLFNQGHLVSNI